MAMGVKSGGRDFEPGHPGMGGRPALSEDAKKLRALFGKKILFPIAARARAPLFMPDARVTLAGFADTLQNILMNLPRATALPKVIVEKEIGRAHL